VSEPAIACNTGDLRRRDVRWTRIWTHLSAGVHLVDRLGVVGIGPDSCGTDPGLDGRSDTAQWSTRNDADTVGEPTTTSSRHLRERLADPVDEVQRVVCRELGRFGDALGQRWVSVDRECDILHGRAHLDRECRLGDELRGV
jgi:hypothetical protein